jgi:signal transduction histidine kinase
MSQEDAVTRVKGWLRPESLRRHRLVIEAVAAGIYFLIFVNYAVIAGAIGFFSLAFLAATLVLYRIQPLLSLAVGGIATLGLIASAYLFYANGGGIAVFLPLLAVFFGVAAYGRPPTQWLGLASTVPAALLLVGTGAFPIQQFFGYVLFLFVLAVFVLFWVGGMLVRVNRERRAARTSEVQATTRLGEARYEISLAQERNRVARDVHDIVAHSLAVVIAQADGARYATKNIPAPVSEALENIAATARGALTDVRVLLGELRHNQDAGPQPGMDDLDALIRGFRDSGLEIGWSSFGEAIPVSEATGLAVYRIVQEALTNALRHGSRTSPVELVFDWGTASLAVTVTNPVEDGASVNPDGHGVPGMRERAHLAGGQLDAGGGTGGRFRVRALLPLERTPADTARVP